MNIKSFISKNQDYTDDVIKGMEIPNELKDNISIIPYTKRGGGFVMG
jgi:hypothetical protein